LGVHLGYFELRKYIKSLIDIFIFVHIIYSFLAIIFHRRYQNKNLRIIFFNVYNLSIMYQFYFYTSISIFYVTGKIDF